MTAPTTVTLKIATSPNGFDVDDGGANMTLRAKVKPKVDVGASAGWLNPSAPGSIGRLTSGVPSFAANKVLGVAIDQDFIQQLLYSAWRGGGLVKDVTNAVSGQNTLTSSGYQQIGVKIRAELPPVVKQTGNATRLEVGMGDLRVETKMKDAARNQVTVVSYVSLTTEVELSINAEGKIALRKVGAPVVDSEVTEINRSSSALDTFLGGMGASINNVIVEQLESAFVTLPIPAFDLSDAPADFALPRCAKMVLTNPQVRSVGRFLYLEGNVAMEQQIAQNNTCM